MQPTNSPSNTQEPVLSGKVVIGPWVAPTKTDTMEVGGFWSRIQSGLINYSDVINADKRVLTPKKTKAQVTFTLKQFMAYIKEKQRSRPYRVQWYRDGQGIKGANTTSYTLTSDDQNCEIISVHHKPIF
jgi:hypothetical protein